MQINLPKPSHEKLEDNYSKGAKNPVDENDKRDFS